VAKPTYMSEFPDGTDVTTLGVGAAMMGMGTYDHQQQLAGVLEAQAPDGRHLFRRVVVQQPRRSAKTTTIWATLIGRCLTYPGYTVVTTAQDGTRAGDKIREVMEVLETFGFEEYGHGKLYWSNGKERIRFDNGSVISVVAPKPGTFRSKAADCILFDEAGELDTELGSALLAGALPLMDTRVNPQIIIAGTPGEQRAGLLWDALEDGRANKPRIGIVDYCATDDDQTTLIDEASDTVILNTELVERVHPGIGTLTTLEVIQERFEDMTLALFEREYLGKWPVDAFSAAIDPALWLKAMVSPEAGLRLAGGRCGLRRARAPRPRGQLAAQDGLRRQPQVPPSADRVRQDRGQPRPRPAAQQDEARTAHAVAGDERDGGSGPAVRSVAARRTAATLRPGRPGCSRHEHHVACRWNWTRVWT
jgi:hypothetical protein